MNTCFLPSPTLSQVPLRHSARRTPRTPCCCHHHQRQQQQQQQPHQPSLSSPKNQNAAVSRRDILLYGSVIASTALVTSLGGGRQRAEAAQGKDTAPTAVPSKGNGADSGNDNSSDNPTTTTTVAAEKPVSDIDPATDEPVITDRVYFDFEIAGSSGSGSGGGRRSSDGDVVLPIGDQATTTKNRNSQRLVIGLYGELMPLVVDNFKRLARASSSVNNDNNEYGYGNTKVYRIVPGLTIQLGDVLNNKGKSGRRAQGLLDDGDDNGESFTPDNFRVKHTIPGIVSMVRRPDGSVDSRFFIATREGDSMYLDGRYAAFGRVVDGMSTLKAIERAGGEGFIKRPVRIISCGLLEGG